MATAVAYFHKIGATLLYGDAEAHLDIARRIIDSRTPGWAQVGTTWLPLPHLLLIPLVRNDWLWQTGLAGAIASAGAMAIGCGFLFAAVARVCRSHAAAWASTAVFVLNPNTLYLGSIPMTESFFFAALFALLYFSVRFGETRRWGALTGAAVAGFAAALTRYEGWFLLPFVALYVLLRAGSKRWLKAIVFCLISGLAPLLWLAHNRWYFGDPLYFYRGPWSAVAIQGNTSYPGRGNWVMAARYFFEAARLNAGWVALVAGVCGLVAIVILRRAFIAIILLALPPLFYVWSMHSSATPIFVPTLWPNTYYNVRYGTSLLPLLALGVGGIVAGMVRAVAGKLSSAAACVAVVLCAAPVWWQGGGIVLKEAQANSGARLQWVHAASAYLRAAAGPHETYFTSFGDLTAIYRTLGVHLTDTLTGDNEVAWDGAVARADMLLHTDWAVAMGGDTVQTVVDRARLHGPRYELVARITVKGAPAIEIYRRMNENPVH